MSVDVYFSRRENTTPCPAKDLRYKLTVRSRNKIYLLGSQYVSALRTPHSLQAELISVRQPLNHRPLGQTALIVTGGKVGLSFTIFRERQLLWLSNLHLFFGLLFVLVSLLCINKPSNTTAEIAWDGKQLPKVSIKHYCEIHIFQ